MIHYVLGFVVLAVSLLASPTATPGGVMARFEDGWLDLSEDWGEAQACLIGDDAAVCFRTEDDLDAHLGDSGAGLLACGGTLRLYDEASFGLPMVSLLPSTSWRNLSSVGFNNRTSSYRVGACDAILADPAGGALPWYPTSLTQANMSGSIMPTSWDNRISSIFYG